MPPRIPAAALSALPPSRLLCRSAASTRRSQAHVHSLPLASDASIVGLVRQLHHLALTGHTGRSARSVLPPLQQRWKSASARETQQQQQQQQQHQQKQTDLADDPMKEVKRLSDDKLAGHNFPHAKLVRSLSPEEEQGSPVEEFFARDNDAMRFAPKVVRDKLGASAAAAAAAAPQPTQPAQSSPTSPSSSKPPGSRSYSTSATTTPVPEPASGDMDALLAMMNNPEQPQSQGQPPAPSPAGAGTVDGRAGLKFEMPPTPDYATGYLRKRYDPVLDQFTKMLMRHGQLATAERNMSAVIDILRTSPPPRLDPGRRLLYPLAPAEFPLNPLLYLTNAVDSVAPLLRIRQMKGAAGGGMSLPVPRPLNSRQRRRTAIAWILDASAKRRDYALPKRVAEEIIAVVEGRSGIWQKRDMLHKMGITARTNMSLGGGRR